MILIDLIKGGVGLSAARHTGFVGQSPRLGYCADIARYLDVQPEDKDLMTREDGHRIGNLPFINICLVQVVFKGTIRWRS